MAAKRKIEDVGQKIGGARKDTHGNGIWSRDLPDTEEVPGLGKLWPAVDYERLAKESNSRGLEGGFVASAEKVLRAAVPTRPRRSYRVRSWAADVDRLHDLAVQVREGKITTNDSLKEALQEQRWRHRPVLPEDIHLRVSLLEKAGFPKALRKINLGKLRVSKHRGEGQYYWGYGNGGALDGMTLSQALPKIAEWYENDRKRKDAGQRKTKKPPKIHGYQVRDDDINGYVLGFRKNGVVVFLANRTFEQRSDMWHYYQEHRKDLQEEAMAATSPIKMRYSTNRPRTGPDRRGARAITPEELLETFGFRGIEFGNWVNQKERQKVVSVAYDALCDMSEALGLPRSAMGLDGSLGLAFGARGKGGRTAAHYEPDYKVINLTKPSGAGNLAHEWFHALDNHLGNWSGIVGSGGHGSHLTSWAEAPTRGRARLSVARSLTMPLITGIYVGISEVMEAMESPHSELARRSKNADATRRKAYYRTPWERGARAFEAYVKHKLKQGGITNDFLVNYRSEGETVSKNYPFPTEAEMPAFTRGFNYLFTQLRQLPQLREPPILIMESHNEYSPIPPSTGSWNGSAQGANAARRRGPS
ncbi:LPD1 domain-containing protein [Thiolapillus sp.]|uniref:LPD1 domain-containing protein n=4 Tax=Thiolapillus sp. TaxID=2017437 RepID=UPI0025D35F03|nr:LPD1 domain-containing protein [Thiolapillus sp.]